MQLVNPGSFSARAPPSPWPDQDRAIYSPTGLPPGLTGTLDPSTLSPGLMGTLDPSTLSPGLMGQLDPSTLSPAPQPDAPSAPEAPADAPHFEEPPQYAEYAPSQAPSYRSPPRSPILYTTELIIFGFVGWAWLSVREYVGQTPVLDATVILSTLICSCLNLLAVLLLPSPEHFAPFAQGFFSHALTVAVFYAYSLSESTALQSPVVDCGASNATVAALYARAYFGGLPWHQIPACVTMAYLVIVLLLSAAQAGACVPLPRRWFLRGVPQAASALFLLHLALFALAVPLADPMAPFAATLVCLAVLHLLCIADLGWVLGLFFRPEARHKLNVLQGAIEMGLVGLSVILANLYAAVLSDGHPSPALLVLFTLLLLFSVLLFGNELTSKPLAVPSARPKAHAQWPAHSVRPLLSTRHFLALPRGLEGKNK